MKKLLATLMVLVLVFGTAVSGAGIDKVNIKPPKDEKIAKQLAIVEKLKEKSNDQFQIQFDKENGNPRFISGNLSDKPVKTSDEAASYLESNKDLFKVTTGSFEIKKVTKDEIGMTHYRAAYTVDGIPVYGGELILHTDKDGNVTTINGSIDSSIPAKAWKNEIKLTSAEAIKAAEATLGFIPDANTYIAKPEAQIYLYKAKDGWQPVYIVKLNFHIPYPANMVIFVNAENGSAVNSYNAIKNTQVTGTGITCQNETKTINLEYANGKYSMTDKSRPAIINVYTANHQELGAGQSGTIVEDTDNVFDSQEQRAAVSAQINFQKVYDYWKNTFNRNSVDGNGMTIKGVVHIGQNYNNAYWDGFQMCFGDGDGVSYKDFAGCLDVIAHEFGHAIHDSVAPMAYQYQSGAICEHFADVWAYLVDNDDWTIGEGCTITKAALRSIADPHLFNQPDNMSEYVPLDSDYDMGGVHLYCGIPNKAFYNAAIQINDNNKIAQVYFRAMSQYLWSTAEFVDLRNAVVVAANDIYGSSTAQIFHNAFLSAGIDPNAHDTYEPNDRLAWAYPIESNKVYNSYISKSSDVDLYKLTVTTAGPIAATLANLPCDYDLYLLDANGTILKRAEHGGTTNEVINYSASAAGTYYVKIVPFLFSDGSGNCSDTQAYSLNVVYPNGAPLAPLTYVAQVIETAHDYANNTNDTKTYTKPGATRVGVHFTRIETENGYDYVIMKDKNGNTYATYCGSFTDVYVEVPGDTIQIIFTSDSSVVKYGYQIDKVGYYMQ